MPGHPLPSPRGRGRSTPCRAARGRCRPACRPRWRRASHASSARSATCVQGERVGVGVGAPLGERAEPAADVADVGEVDVPVDDVGDVVADRRRGAGRRRARHSASRSAPSALQQRQARRASEQPGRVVLGGRSAASTVAVAGGQRGRVPVAAPTCLAAARPSRRRRRRSRRAGRRCGPSVSIVGVQVGAARRCAKPPSGSCQGRPDRARVLAGQAGRRVGQGARRAASSRGSSHGSPAQRRTPGGRSAARAASKPASAVSARPARRACGQGRSGLTWSGVSGETPPQSSMPAPSSSRHSVEVDQVRRRLDPRLRAEHQPGDRDRRRGTPRSAEVVGVPHRGVGLGPEVLDDHLLHVRRTARATGADREDRLGPLGEGLADADQHAGGERDRRAGRRPRAPAAGRRGPCPGEPKCGPPGSRTAASAVVSSIIPIDGATGLSRCSSSQRHARRG